MESKKVKKIRFLLRLVAFAILISVSSFSQNQDNTSPTVSLTDSDSDNLVYSSNVVTITATFSEAMSSTPTISITSEISNALMLPGNDIVLKQNNGWVSSSGRFNTNSNPYLFNNALEFSYIDNQYIYKDFNITPGTSSVNLIVDYDKNFTADTGKVVLKFYNGSSHISANDSNSGTLTGSSTLQTYQASLSVPNNANKIRVELHQLNEGEYWAGSYGFRFKNLILTGVENGSSTRAVWTYPWMVASTNSSTAIVSVSGSDLAGNAYSGTDSITFTVGDNSAPSVLITENDNNNLLANSDVVTFTANFSETMTPSPTITIRENDQPVTFYISDYSSNQIGINVQNRRFDQLTRNSNSIVGYTFEVVSSGVTYTLTSLNNQSQSWVYFSTTPEFTPGASGSNGNLDVLLKGKTLINNAYMTPISGTNSYTYSYTTSTVLNSISATVSGQDQSGNSYSGSESITLSVDNVNPLVYGFSSTDQDYITTSSGTVTYTVRFSEDMESSPQLNIVGISPLNYSQTVSLTYVSTNNSNGDSTWTYGWSPPASITSGTVSISITGNDLAGNPYNAQIENVISLKHKRLQIDNVQPTVSLSSTVSGTAVAQSNSVTITALFSEPMTESPTISISGQISNATMSLVSTNTLIRREAQLSLSDYGYNMIAVGSRDWDDILGANVQSGDLLNYYLEIDGVDYQVSEIKLGSKTASDFWWYFATTPEYTPGYNAGETTYFVIKSPNYQTELSNWQYSWTVSSTSSTPTITVSGTDLASNSISGTTSLTFLNTSLSQSNALAEKVRVIDVSSPSTSKTYKRGEQILINVSFSGTVSVTGIPYIEIDTGWRVGRATYSGGSGTSTLTFNYTVSQFDQVDKLNYINQNSLVQSGRIIPWGSVSDGGAFSVGANYADYNNNVVSGLDSNVLQIYPLGNETESRGFGAYKSGNSFITWGNPNVGAIYPDRATQYQENRGTIRSDVLKNFLDGNIIDITTTWRSLAILNSDGSVKTWGDCDCGDLFAWTPSQTASTSTNSSSTSLIVNTEIGNKLQSDILKVYASRTSFAALKKDGTVVTWGNPRAGGLGDGFDDSNYNMQVGIPINNLKNVKEIYSTDRAFAALKYDGSIVTWGALGDGFDNKSGANSSSVSSSLSSSVSKVFSTGRAFAALKNDGSVVTWGSNDYGGDSSSVSSQLQGGVTHIFTTRFAFAALKTNGSLVVWGNSAYGPGNSTSVNNQLQSGVIDVQSTEGAFAALKDNGTIVVWGRSGWGDNIGQITNSNFTKIVGNQSAFSALKTDGSVVSWGTVNSAGGDNSSVSNQISSNVIDIFSTNYSFTALRTDGSVVTWGSVSGNASSTAEKFSKIYSNSNAYVGLVGNDILDQSGNNVITTLLRKNGKNPYQIDSSIALDGKSPTVELLVESTSISPSQVTTITAVFSEAIISSPSISLSDQISHAAMSSLTAKKWIYEFTPSQNVTTTFATVSATDLQGNVNSGLESLTLVAPISVVLTSVPSTTLVKNSDVVTITATFSKEMTVSPTISLSGIISNVLMTPTSDNRVWNYSWTVSSSQNFVTATVSKSGLPFNPNLGTQSITYTLDNTGAIISTASITTDNSEVSLIFSEEVFTEILSGVATNTLTTSDFLLSISGAPGISLTSTNPSSISKTGSSTYNLTIPISGYVSGSVTLTIAIAENNIYDRAGNSTALSKSISLNSNLLFDYDISNTNSYNGQASSNNNKTVNDLSGNGNHGEITNTDNVYYDTNQNAMFFNGITARDGGIAISNLNYVSGSSDKIEELTIFARIKVDSRPTTDRASNDERIVLSFDRSSVFRFSVGSDQNTSAKGKLAFHFTNSDATFDTHAVNTSDLRDNQWHNVAVTFKANQSGGLKYYIDGSLVYTHSGTFAPISNGSNNETPRFGYVGTGSEATSFKGSASPTNLFFGHIQSIKYYNKVLESSQLNGLDTNAPTVTLSDNILSNYINGTETLRIISTFNEAMSSSPKISISGQVSNLTMTSSTTSVWYYDWNVPDSFNGEVTATVTGTDLAGNSYSGTDSITYIVDNILPTVSLADSNSGNIITNSNQVSITATFSEPMTVSPTISIANVITNVVMTATSSASVWIYPWVVSTTYSGIVSATVSGTDLARNSYSGGDSLSFNLDTRAPEIVSLSINNLNNQLILNFSEQSTLHDKSSNSFTVTNTSDYFSIGVTSGTATITVNSMTYNADTNNTKYVFGININGIPDGFEVITITPKTNKVKDAIGNYALTSQSSNTINLNNTLPVISGLEINEANTQAIITFSEPVYNNASGTGALQVSDFQLSLSSGSATLSSTVPISITSSGSLSYVLGLSFQGLASGQEVLNVSPVSNSVFDSKGGQVNLSSSQSNTITLNDKARPEITGVSIGESNEFIDIQFSEGIYGNASSNAPVLVSSLGISQIAGLISPLRITQLTNISGGQLTGGENIIRATLTQSLDISNTLVGVIQANNPVSIDISSTNIINSLSGPTGDKAFQVLVTNANIYDISANQVSPTQSLNYIRSNTINTVIPSSPNIFRLGAPVNVNPPPIVITRVIRFKEKPENGKLVGEVKAFDPEGESFTFLNQSDLFDGSLQIDEQGKINVIEGTNLKYDSDYNAAEFKFILNDSENEVEYSVLIIIQKTHPEIKIEYFKVDENAPVGSVVAKVKFKDPLNPSEIIPFKFQSSDGYLEFNGEEIVTTRELDYETLTEHCFNIEAIGSPKEDLSENRYITTLDECFQVIDLPNQKSERKFFISIFGLPNNSSSSKVDHRRYYNPHNKNVGKWKVKKRIKGGADADKFTIRTASKGEQKNSQYNEEETEDYLEFIKTPVFSPPGDANQDNIYEVEVEYINTADGEPEVPIGVTQTNIQVPEGGKKAIELQARPALPTDDTDGDGVFDIYDNSPLVYNVDQTDEDGDGVGDVSDDFDHDGVWNPFDTCPDTPLGEVVNLSGCLIYYVPSNNFSLSKIEKCAGENSIRLDVLDSTITYNISVSGAVNKTESFTGNTWSLDKLSGGTYSICVNIEGVSYLEFERCFELNISDPKPLVVSGIFDKSNQTVTYDLSGGDVYNISHNGKTTQTQSSKHTISLNKGLNKIKISTGIECQGLHEDNYLNSYEVKYAPNPIENYLDLYFGGNDDFIEIGIYTVNGQLIDIKNINLPFYSRNYRLETSNYKQGVYIIKMSGATIDQSIQVIKK